MGVVSGPETIPYLFTGTFIAMLVLTPIFGWLVSRLSKQVFLPLTYFAFLVSFIAFHFVMKSGELNVWAARAFFIWVAVFGVYGVAVFWSLMADVFSKEQGKRLFGFIAAGGSIGALVGPTLTALLVGNIGISGLLLVMAGLLALLLVLLSRLLVAVGMGEEHQDDKPIGGSVWAGVTAIFASKRVGSIAIMVGVLVLVQTFFYNYQAYAAKAAFGNDDAAKTQFFALVDLGANATALFGQVFLFSFLQKKIGAGWTLAIQPVLLLVAGVAILIAPNIVLFGVIQSIRRGLEYGVTKPSRDLLYTGVDDEAKYKAKNAIDNLIYRSGDVLGGYLFMGAAALLSSVGAVLAVLSVPFAALLTVVSFKAGRRFDSEQVDK